MIVMIVVNKLLKLDFKYMKHINFYFDPQHVAAHGVVVLFACGMWQNSRSS